MVPLAANLQGPRDFVRRMNLESRSPVTPSVLVNRDPLVVCVGNDKCAVREQHLPTWSVSHWRCDCHHLCRDTALIEYRVADFELAHRSPANGRRDRRVEGERLALEPRDEVVRELGPFERLAEHELAGV